ncbi:MAG: DUF2798 domain-containing protein [Betaproteobacteria bacterium]
MTSPEPKPLTRSPLGFTKLPASYARFVLPFFLSVVMTCVISGVSSLRGVGFSAAFLPLWLGSWSLSWVFAYPTLLVVLPLARRATAAFVRSE